ncbi:retrotransposon protein, putative, ty1-copia subclass [Tanacetum coccineum]
MDGNVHNFKARLVVKGFTQTYKVDYVETFSPVAYIRAIRILLAIAAYYDYEIWKIDVKTAFLNGHLSEDVYMVQPQGFVDPKHPNKVCKLQHSIYGLNQASRSWIKRFDEEIKKISFTQNPDEPCVYLKASGSNVVFLVLIRISNIHTWIQDLRKRSKWLIALIVQRATLEKILKKIRMENSNKGYTPMIEMSDYRKSQGAKTPTEVQRMQIFLMLLAVAVWMRKFIDGLRDVMPSNKIPMDMLCDNEPALAIASDPGILKGARHFQRKYHYIREVIQEVIQRGEIVLKKVHTDGNVADQFTKPMPFNKHFEHAMKIGIVNASSLITWMAFGGNTRDLDSFGEKTDKITDLHQIYEEVLFTERGDGVAGIKRRNRGLSGDGVRDLAKAS